MRISLIFIKISNITQKLNTRNVSGGNKLKNCCMLIFLRNIAFRFRLLHNLVSTNLPKIIVEIDLIKNHLFVHSIAIVEFTHPYNLNNKIY